MAKKKRKSNHVAGSSSFARVLNNPSSLSKVTRPAIAGSLVTSAAAPPSVSETLVETVRSSHPSPVVEVGSSSVRSGSSPSESIPPVEAKGCLPTTPSAQSDSPPLSVPASEISSAGVKTSPVTVSAAKPWTSNLPWATNFKASLRNLKKMTPPSYLEDGTPVVDAPASVLLRTAEMWKGHIVAQFHGLCPPLSRIFNDLNPIWGRYGSITVRVMSETACLIFIPSVATREWVLDVAFWQAGNCSCTVYPWSPEGPLELEELQSAPTWAILKNIPPQLYSLDGISVIASGIGEPLHTEKSRLDPINIGVTKVKVIIQLDTTLPTTVIVKDTQGNTARVAVEYPRPPPKCLNCGRFGHLISRCPKPLMKKPPFKKNSHAGTKEVSHPSVILPSTTDANGSDCDNQMSVIHPRLAKPRRNRSRSRKRAKSTSPRIAISTPTSLPDLVVPSPEDSAEALREFSRRMVPMLKNRGQSSQEGPSKIKKTSSKDALIPESRIPAKKEESVSQPGSQTKAAFPIPPGWGVISLSTPRLGEAPKVGEALGVGISAVPTPDKLSTHAQAKGKYYKEKPTGMANSGIIQPPQISLSSPVAGSNHFSPDPGESQKGKSKEIPPDFPLPLGWGAMSKKSRKKELKKWHNHINSVVSGSCVAARGPSSSRTSLH